MEIDERQEYVMQVCNAYDELLMMTENRGISYGELAHIQSLNDDDLDALYDEIMEKMEEWYNGIRKWRKRYIEVISV